MFRREAAWVPNCTWGSSRWLCRERKRMRARPSNRPRTTTGTTMPNSTVSTTSFDTSLLLAPAVQFDTWTIWSGFHRGPWSTAHAACIPHTACTDQMLGTRVSRWSVDNVRAPREPRQQ